MAASLNAVAAEEDHRDRIRSDLSVEAVKGTAHRLFVEVFPNINLETVAAQLVGERTRVLKNRRQGRVGIRIIGVGDQERDARVALRESSEAAGRNERA